MKKQKLKPEGRFGILNYLSDRGGVGHIRTIWPFTYLGSWRYEKMVFDPIYSSQFIINTEFYNSIGFVRFQRSATQNQLNMIKYFQSNIRKQTNTPAIYEIDDLLYNIPPSNFAHEYYMKNFPYIEEMLRIVDGITVSTPTLRKFYLPYNNNISVVRNKLVKFMWGDIKECKPVDRKRPKILYPGSQNHFSIKDVTNQGGDMGKTLLDFIMKTKDEYEWIFVGGSPQELSNENKITYIPWVNLSEYPMFMKNFDADIAIAPLEINDFNRCKCLTADSRLVTKKGITKICDIKNGDFVWQEHDFKKVGDAFKYYNQKTIELITKKGFKIEGTLQHRLRSNGEFKEIKDFKIGDFLDIGFFDIKNKQYQEIQGPLLLTKKLDSIDLYKTKKDNLPRIIINEDWGRFIGYILGDGHVSSSCSAIGLCSHKDEKEVIEDFTSFLESIGLNWVFCKSKSVIDDGNGLDIFTSSRNLKWLLTNELKIIGRYGKNFKVPDLIFNSPKSVIREFIRGLFEADGSVSASSVQFSTKSKELAEDIHLLLMGFGIISSITKQYNKKYKKYYYRVNLYRQACDIFYEKIGFVSTRKNSSLNKIKSKSHSNAYKEWTMNDVVVEINESRNDVYDIEIPESNYYTANGIISHNSDIKLLEYCISGFPGVYTKIDPYEDASLTSETEEDMIEKIKWLLKSSGNRYNTWKNDTNKVKNRLFFEDNVKKWVNEHLKLFKKEI